MPFPRVLLIFERVLFCGPVVQQLLKIHAFAKKVLTTVTSNSMHFRSAPRLCTRRTRATCSVLFGALIFYILVWFQSHLIPLSLVDEQLVLVRFRDSKSADPGDSGTDQQASVEPHVHLFPDEETDDERRDPLRRAFAQLFLEPAHIAAARRSREQSGAGNKQSASDTALVRPILVLVMTGLHMPFFQPKAGLGALVEAGCPVSAHLFRNFLDNFCKKSKGLTTLIADFLFTILENHLRFKYRHKVHTLLHLFCFQ